MKAQTPNTTFGAEELGDAELQALMLEVPDFRIEQVTETKSLPPDAVTMERSKFIVRTAGNDQGWPSEFVADVYINDMLDDRHSLFVHPDSRVALGKSLVRFLANAPSLVRSQQKRIRQLEGELRRLKR